MKRLLPFVILLISVFSCKNETKPEIQEDTELKELFSLMQGSFNSEIQAQIDSSYYNISLHMYPIWEDKGNFLYVEQALTSTPEKPYRQRIYEVNRESDSTFSSAIYKLDVDSIWVGKWKTPKAFDSIALKNISLKEGCDVILKRIRPNHFMGKTGDNTCSSTMRGASFARSEVEILEDKVISWDRGFDADGNYVWGAEKSGYIFNKID
ncbi:chromophore lyase CpcT/CpeT [Winogradskyella thalassocola]|uniref:CpeT/CpcT family n=1 Tax=Winogradskyella thalassocola TaxID=262004 RepID=A0A1G8I8I4_9FLAO|nr:chromophore lyase CpcT/CpeT [Winogradskyella thalassocola]SDI15061.1 CpeT/CpcT family [Winogradskyella thalassocola]